MIGNDEFLSLGRNDALRAVAKHLYDRLHEVKDHLDRLDMQPTTPSNAVAQNAHWNEMHFLRDLLNLIERS